VADILDQYTIQFSGLANGKHAFDFQADDRFFGALEGSVVEAGQIRIDLEIEKTSQLLNLQFNISGTVNLNCDRCAAGWAYPIETSNRLILRFSDGSVEGEDPDILYISRNEYQFNISQHIYEYIATALPFHIIPCEIAGDQGLCDQEVLSRLNAMQSQDQGHEESIDPRWDALKNIENKFK
jgi:uncharacterized protein